MAYFSTTVLRWLSYGRADTKGSLVYQVEVEKTGWFGGKPAYPPYRFPFCFRV